MISHESKGFNQTNQALEQSKDQCGCEKRSFFSLKSLLLAKSFFKKVQNPILPRLPKFDQEFRNEKNIHCRRWTIYSYRKSM